MAKKGTGKKGGKAKRFRGYKLNRPRSSANYRLIRPEGMSDATWEAFRKVHGSSKTGLGKHIFGQPRGTGALQAAINNPKAFNPETGEVNWKKQRDKKVIAGIEQHRGDGPHGSDIRAWYDSNQNSKKNPSSVKKALKRDWYKVAYGPDGKAR